MEKMIETHCGVVQGSEGQYANIYKGIPYAAAPVGALRFCAPQPCPKWEGVRRAERYAAQCPQPGHEPGSFYYKEFYADPATIPPSSEDCLYLNIWTPKKAERCPVALWVHGGAFMNGNGGELPFDGEGFAKRGVILVTINYRLGIFGFFCHPALTKRDGTSGNYGLLDQLAAVDWVRENIAAFGGDPDKITIFGQSAGELSIQALISSSRLAGKVRGVILQSGSGYPAALSKDVTRDEQQAKIADYLARRGIDIETVLHCPATELLALGNAYREYLQQGSDGLVLPMVPVIDGDVVPLGSDAAVEHGLPMEIPYMIGCTKDDIAAGPDGPRDRNKSPQYRGVVGWCAAMAARRIPCYAYYFAHDLPGDDSGAFHSAELWYTFGRPDRCWRPMAAQDYALAERMSDIWAAFVRDGNPGWPAYTQAAPYVQTLDVAPSAGAQG